jgi:hypothetical protein
MFSTRLARHFCAILFITPTNMRLRYLTSTRYTLALLSIFLSVLVKRYIHRDSLLPGLALGREQREKGYNIALLVADKMKTLANKSD